MINYLFQVKAIVLQLRRIGQVTCATGTHLVHQASMPVTSSTSSHQHPLVRQQFMSAFSSQQPVTNPRVLAGLNTCVPPPTRSAAIPWSQPGANPFNDNATTILYHHPHRVTSIQFTVSCTLIFYKHWRCLVTIASAIPSCLCSTNLAHLQQKPSLMTQRRGFTQYRAAPSLSTFWSSAPWTSGSTVAAKVPGVDGFVPISQCSVRYPWKCHEVF